jgi:hypothetical protein
LRFCRGEAARDEDREEGTAERWVGMVQSIASGGGLHHTRTGSRVTTCYQLLLREWNKGKRKNRVPVPA